MRIQLQEVKINDVAIAFSSAVFVESQSHTGSKRWGVFFAGANLLRFWFEASNQRIECVAFDGTRIAGDGFANSNTSFVGSGPPAITPPH